jgi:HEAT repeat protein
LLVNHGGVGPKLGPAEAQIAVRLLLGATADRRSEIRGAAADALGHIVRQHPREADAMTPALTKMLADTDSDVMNRAAFALADVVRAAPERAQSIAPALVETIRTRHRPKSGLIQALSDATKQSTYAGAASVPAMAALFRDSNQFDVECAAAFLGELASNHPSQIREIVPAVLKLGEDSEPRAKAAASYAMAVVANAVCRTGQADNPPP